MWNLNIYDMQMPDSSMRATSPVTTALPQPTWLYTVFGGGGETGGRAQDRKIRRQFLSQ